MKFLTGRVRIRKERRLQDVRELTSHWKGVRKHKAYTDQIERERDDERSQKQTVW